MPKILTFTCGGQTPRTVILLIVDGIVRQCNMGDNYYYIGETEDETRLGLSSVLRYYDPGIDDNEYPLVAEMELVGVSIAIQKP